MTPLLLKFRYLIVVSLLFGIGSLFYSRKSSPAFRPVKAAAISMQKQSGEPLSAKKFDKNIIETAPVLQKYESLTAENPSAAINSFSEKTVQLPEEKLEAAPLPPSTPFSFEGSELTEEAIAPYIRPETPPEAIHYYSENGNEKLVPKVENAQASSNGSGDILSVATNGAVKKIADEREASANQRAVSGVQESVNKGLQEGDQAASPNTFHTINYPGGHEAFMSPLYFYPGKRNNKKGNVTAPMDWIQRVSGVPDYIFDHVAKGNLKHLEAIQSKVLSLGHGGEILFEIKNVDFYYDRPGNDFSIYENVFTDDRDGLNYQEYAHVGISDKRDDGSFLWFSCNPKNQDINRCAGVVKTSDGGDRFDMAELGLKKIKYIKIIDTGDNYNPKYASKNTEGFDLDTIELIK